MDEFVIEKYIEINKGINISLMYKFILIQIIILIMLQYNRIDRKYVHIFVAKDISKKVKLVALVKGHKKHK